jgi:hypothetical protein
LTPCPLVHPTDRELIGEKRLGPVGAVPTLGGRAHGGNANND